MQSERALNWLVKAEKKWKQQFRVENPTLVVMVIEFCGSAAMAGVGVACFACEAAAGGSASI